MASLRVSSSPRPPPPSEAIAESASIGPGAGTEAVASIGIGERMEAGATASAGFFFVIDAVGATDARRVPAAPFGQLNCAISDPMARSSESVAIIGERYIAKRWLNEPG